MLKFYLVTVLIWFLIFIAESILFKRKFIESRDKIRKETNNNTEIYKVTKMTFLYFAISCIPLFRLIMFAHKICFTFYPDEYLKMLKEVKQNDK